MKDKIDGKDVVIVKDSKLAGYLYNRCGFRIEKIKADRDNPDNVIAGV